MARHTKGSGWKGPIVYVRGSSKGLTPSGLAVRFVADGKDYSLSEFKADTLPVQSVEQEIRYSGWIGMRRDLANNKGYEWVGGYMQTLKILHLDDHKPVLRINSDTKKPMSVQLRLLRDALAQWDLDAEIDAAEEREAAKAKSFASYQEEDDYEENT